MKIDLLILLSAVRKVEGGLPSMLSDVGGRTQLEVVLSQYNSLVDMGATPIVTLQSSDCKFFHLDDIVKSIWSESSIVRIQGETAGAACSALLAIDSMNLKNPLLVVNGDHLLDVDLPKFVSELQRQSASAGLVVFDSLNPRFSYVRVDHNGRVEEVAEKKLISRNATAGVYYFSSGELFVKSICALIKKQMHFGGRYYIAPSLNEVILSGGTVLAVKVPANKYQPLSPLNIPIKNEAP